MDLTVVCLGPFFFVTSVVGAIVVFVLRLVRQRTDDDSGRLASLKFPRFGGHFWGQLILGAYSSVRCFLFLALSTIGNNKFLSSVVTPAGNGKTADRLGLGGCF